MRKRMLVLAAIAALFVMSCDVAGLATQFIPGTKPPAEQPESPDVQPTTGASARATTGLSSSGNPFSGALTKAMGVTKFRIEFSMIVGGMTDGKYTETPFINFNGEVDGQNIHMTSKGGILAMLAGDDKTPLEFVQSGGKSYVKGMGLMGLYDPKVWYIDDNNTGSSFASMAKPDSFNDWISGSKAGDFQKARSESLDGQSCDVYLYNMKSLPSELSMLSAFSSSGNSSALGATDKAEASFWLCGDGYVHKFQLDFQGHDPKDATQKGGMKVVGHMWDYGNAAISIIAPKDAKPMSK